MRAGIDTSSAEGQVKILHAIEMYVFLRCVLSCGEGTILDVIAGVRSRVVVSKEEEFVLTGEGTTRPNDLPDLKAWHCILLPSIRASLSCLPVA